MINGLEGIPGSGKSYEACVFQVLAAVKEGRKVITNLPLVVEAYAAIDPGYRELIEIRYTTAPVRGQWNADAVDPETGQGSAFTLFEDGHTEPAPEGSRPFGTVWDYWSDWKHPKTGKGPLFVIDECHVPMPKIGTEMAVVEWYKLHRHFNCDVLLATQVFRKMCPDIAEIMAMVVKVRKADVLGKSDQYIRKVHAGYRGAVIQEGLRKYEPHFFALYKSHTQGNSVLESDATDVAPFAKKFQRYTRGAWAMALVAVAGAAWFIMRDKPAPSSRTKASIVAQGNAVIRSDGTTDFEALRKAIDADKGKGAPTPSTVEEKPAAASSDPAPYDGKGLHVTGPITMKGRTVYMFVVSSAGTAIAQVSSVDLERAGYKWEPLTDCAGYLRWKGTAKALNCDAPALQSGSQGRPLVMNGGYGSDGRVPAAAADITPKSPSIVTM